MVQAIFVAINVLLLWALLASAVMWGRLLRHRWRGHPAGFFESILPMTARERPFWSPVDALVMLGTQLVSTQAFVIWMITQGWMEAPAGPEPAVPETPTGLLASIAATAIGGLCGLLVVLIWLRTFHFDARRRIGLTMGWSDVALGLRGSVMLLPPVLLISALVSLFVRYEHPVLQSLAALTTPTIFAATYFATAVITPVVEEVLFRGLLQGGMQAIADRRVEQVYAWKDWHPVAWWPIFVSSFIFAAMHVGQGAAPIPLFFLGLGLGYLYRQTGSLAQPIVVHMVLNGLTLVVELLKQSLPPA